MEPRVPRPRGRPRKRRRPEEETDSAADAKSNPQNKKRSLETRSIVLLGRYVLKEFEDNGVFLGKIMSYETGLYRVEYEDGDCEDLESRELRELILEDRDFDDDLSERKKNLDELISIKNMKKKDKGPSENAVNAVETSKLSELDSELAIGNDGEQVEGDADSSSDSCEHGSDRDMSSEAEVPLVPAPKLPPSSGTIGVPEQYVSHLFSVYGFLRSFSIPLFLSPFGLDDFVGSLICSAPNTLLDAIHVALMRTLRRHLETISSEGSEPASKCLRCLDWSLLDALTWPVYLVQYFTVMGYIKGPDWKGFYEDVSKREYYSLTVGMKLMILQILCDDVLESAELRAEMDMREESEVGVDPEVVAVGVTDNGPRRVHPRYSKTSACKDREVMNIGTESREVKSCKSKSFGSQGADQNADSVNIDMDANSDECRLCGMDGTLLCCDGCPSAYHSRCIGVMKMYIPEGSWYCPECTIDKIGPVITVGTSLRGAELFGVDLYGQVFLGACNYLLVLKASFNAESCHRYYNLNDIPKVLQVLSSSIQCMSLYLDICKAIVQYWNIPESICPPMQIKNRATSPLSTGSESHKVPDHDVNASSFSANKVDNLGVPVLDNTVGKMSQADLTGSHACGVKTGRKDYLLMTVKLPEQLFFESTISAGSVSLQANPSDVTQQSLADGSCSINFSTCISGNSLDSGPVNGANNLAYFGKDMRISTIDCAHKGLSFKPQAYVNCYTNGDLAAAAAARLAVLSLEESQAEANRSGTARKVTSQSDISLQVKAFSSVASRFFWPSAEKRFLDVPRERCGWCYSCKAPASSRRGCMLNSAVSSATKSANKIFNSLPPVKNGEGCLPSIATYILYLEENLRGLVAGPFLSASYRNQWCERLQGASMCSAVKVLLLELEKNISYNALSAEWVKLVDEWLVESSVIQSTSGTIGLSQRRGPGRRRKQSSTSEITAVDCDDKSFSWWQGGRLSKHIFQKAILPCSMVRKAARQGGVRKISGIYYVDGSEIPKRSRQLMWRAAVERSRNASQLALQVRYLDLHVRWNDLVRPEQNLQDGKGLETEASAFRNATICDKKILENRITYGVDFGNQKHLPSRVMKNIIEIEKGKDGKEKYWFHETRVPLYLMKEYEEKMDNVHFSWVKKPSSELSVLQRRQLKASRKDVFAYLTFKRDKSERCPCTSCHLDVLLRNAVTCSTCLGYCHKDCTSSSMNMNGKVELVIVCKHCYHAKGLAQNEIHNRSPITPLPLYGRECCSAMTLAKGTQVKNFSQPLKPVSSVKCQDNSIKTQENYSVAKEATPGPVMTTKPRTKLCNWGVIFRKKNSEESGVDFRLANILLKGGGLDKHFGKPVCSLCEQPYNSDLMYIHCETCKKWYHAEAVELAESRISEVVGFKCCKCRRIGGPECPYMDPEVKEQRRRKRHIKEQKRRKECVVQDSDFGTIFESKNCKPAHLIMSAEDKLVADNDPLLFSLSKVELITENTFEADSERNAALGTALQKLPVRRQLKREGDKDDLSEVSVTHSELPSYPEANNYTKPKEEPTLTLEQLDAFSTGLGNEMLFDYESLNYEDMEFEPQTYFSFNELLASDDGGQVDGDNAPGAALANWEYPSHSISEEGVLEQCGMDSSIDKVEPKISGKSDNKVLHCRLCQQNEPAPDLLCGNCGFLIHGHCSPWVELSPLDGTWRCGRCREWR